MSLISEFELTKNPDWYSVPDHCFFCGTPMAEGPWVCWSGIGAEIWLHPDCAKHLANHLICDAVKV